MKKIFTLIVSLGILSASFAQSGDFYSHQNDNRNVSYHDRNVDQPVYGRTINYPDARADQYGHDGNMQNNRDYNNRDYNDRQRHDEMDRNNRGYDRHDGDYRMDPRNNGYGHERVIMERPRDGRLKSFGGGVILGGIIGVLIGSHL